MNKIIIEIPKHKSKDKEIREDKRKEMLIQVTKLNPSIVNPPWNPCKSSLLFTFSFSNLNYNLINEVEERKNGMRDQEMRPKPTLFIGKPHGCQTVKRKHGLKTAWKSKNDKKTWRSGKRGSTMDHGRHHEPSMAPLSQHCLALLSSSRAH